MTAKIVHFEGAEGFALLTAPTFVGWVAATVAGEMVSNMRLAGMILIQIGAWFTAASLMTVVIVGISAFALATPIPTGEEDGDA